MPENQKSEAQKSLITRWFEEVWNQNRVETIDELLPADCIIHDGEGQMTGPEEFRKFYDGIRAQFSDIRISLHESVCEGDMVCVRWSCTMRHTMQQPGAGKPVHVTGMSMVRYEDSRFVEVWQNWDLHGLTQQIDGAPLRALGAAG